MIKKKYIFYNIIIIFLLLVIIIGIFSRKNETQQKQRYIAPSSLSASATNLLQSDSTGNMSSINLDNIILVGQISYFAFNSPDNDPNPPPRYLVCNGSAISRTVYNNLFNIIGTTFGSGDGSSTFNIPDLRGMFIRGHDPRSGGNDPSRVFGSTQNDALQNIVGQVNAVWVWDNELGYSGAFAEARNHGRQVPGAGGAGGSGGSNGARSFNFDASRSARTSSETRPKNVALLACIRY
jgi:phage-related tail fiber protein